MMLKRTLEAWSLLCLVGLAACVDQRTDVPGAANARGGQSQELSVLPADAAADTPDAASSTSIYPLDSGRKAIVTGKTIVIEDASGKQLAKNTGIVRVMDENVVCPSRGFIRIVSKGIYFTVEQQNCSGWDFIFEFVTFKYSKKRDGYYLHRFGLRYLDRREPDADMLERTYTRKEFGDIPFGEVNVDELYKYR